MVPLTVLVACSAAKQPLRCTAENMYIGRNFRLSRELAQSLEADWWILSAKHGLIHPTTEIDPYDVTVPTRTGDDKERYLRLRARIANRMFAQFPNDQPRKMLVLAPKAYVALLPRRDLRKWEIGYYPDVAYRYILPLAGKGIGQQTQWIKRACETRGIPRYLWSG